MHPMYAIPGFFLYQSFKWDDALSDLGKWLMSKTSSFLNCCSECCSFQISKYQLHIDLNSFYQIFRIIDCLQDKVEIISCKLLNYSSVCVNGLVFETVGI